MLLSVLPMVNDSLALLLASRLAIGIVIGVMAIAASVTLVARYEGSARNAMLGYMTSVGSAVGLVGLVLAGVIAANFHWELAFLIYLLPMVPLLILAILAMPKRRVVPTPATGENLSLVTVKLLWPIYVAAALTFMASTMFGALTPFLLIEEGIANPLAHALVIAMATIGATIGGIAFGRVHSVLGAPRTRALSAVLVGSGAIAMSLATGVIPAGGATFVAGLGMGILFPYLATVVAEVPERLRGHGFALFGTATYLGGFIYPLIVTPLLPIVEESGVFLGLGLVLLVGGFATLAIRRGRPSRPEAGS
jgi:MFS family permease